MHQFQVFRRERLWLVCLLYLHRSYLFLLHENLYFSIQSFEIPITLRWRNATFNNFAFWRIYGGVSIHWNYKNKAKQNSNIILTSGELKKWGATAHISFGYNTWNFYLAYRLNPIFNYIPINNQDLSIQLTPIKFGLIFYIL